ncbi:16S rRNA m(7)G-527 methyltransferase [Prochlorococcus marinus str. MIT 9312]|uniref:Ribosomal RNA small subunit methyltransferase G n=1 Tax=Prochlorococcus marinus (strain MIT 9312) TaxID=74546 RepID=RSMG_PROM9|nr:16S rRNA (guanine(527)-N(7))-methyltransferase RsmG [Prochlorococcus marinus]Q318R7.1 RecName: Full=Ribosomal RNA small subunit methyltransferase G; AltName: Full=16S rRNA 7-methylguanosine methyltransferase; Short=16S rRNA m7G methyltransferase [Prochlorococcus marinus str. MIT 9312]ABB50628.1 16S rRNA m(7)G-527 methyltransferase [Prochlorococcus marinus str. MIT 9312]KGG01530.1 rRNA small subunit 7-methylguanosine (m7G) methyltransferase GidB [Prochlorococcus marinus str. MIT 9311]
MKKQNIPKEISEFITKEEIVMFQELQIKIAELNNKTNLTRLIKGDDYWISQVFDSIWPFKTFPNINFDNKKFLDIGSGCGFPGLAYAITHPNSEIYLIDSSKKKTDALKLLIKEINFKNNIHIINDRIENLAHQSSMRNSFNIATTRAVSNPSTVSEYILPMLKKEGLGVLYCGKWTDEENKNLDKTLEILEGKFKETKKILLPRSKGTRNIILIQPKNLCPEIYPRKIGKPEKHPL